MGTREIVIIEDRNKIRRFFVSRDKRTYTVDHSSHPIFKAATIEVKYSNARKGEVPYEIRIEIRDAVEKYIEEEAKRKKMKSKEEEIETIEEDHIIRVFNVTTKAGAMYTVKFKSSLLYCNATAITLENFSDEKIIAKPIADALKAAVLKHVGHEIKEEEVSK